MCVSKIARKRTTLTHKRRKTALSLFLKRYLSKRNSPKAQQLSISQTRNIPCDHFCTRNYTRLRPTRTHLHEDILDIGDAHLQRQEYTLLLDRHPPIRIRVFFQVFQSFEESNFSRFLDDTLPIAKQFNFHRFVHVLQKVNILRTNGIYCQLLVLIRTLFFVAKSYAFDMTALRAKFYRSITRLEILVLVPFTATFTKIFPFVRFRPATAAFFSRVHEAIEMTSFSGFSLEFFRRV